MPRLPAPRPSPQGTEPQETGEATSLAEALADRWGWDNPANPLTNEEFLFDERFVDPGADELDYVERERGPQGLAHGDHVDIELLRLLDEAAEEATRVRPKYAQRIRSIRDELSGMGFEPSAGSKKPGHAREPDEIDCEIAANVALRWETDGKGKMTPSAFIKKAYGPWLDRPGFTRGHIARHDFRAGENYASWIRPQRHPEDDLKISVENNARSEQERRARDAEHARKHRARRLGLT